MTDHFEMAFPALLASLGADATAEELAAHPGLVEVLRRLDGLHAPCGLRKGTAEALEEEAALERAERKRFLLWRATREAAEAVAWGEDAEAAWAEEENRPAGDADARRDLAELLAVADAGSCLETGQGQRHLLGLRPAGLARACLGPRPAEKRREAAARAAPLVDAELRERLRDLLQFAAPDAASRPESLARHVEVQAARAGALRVEAEQSRRAAAASAAHAARTLADTLETACDAVEDEQLGQARDDDRARRDWTRERVATLHRKLAVLRHELLADTYTPEAVRALQRARRHVDREAAAATEELRAASERARGYELAGPGFERIAAEYAELQGKIANKRWTLEQLHGEGL